jgi:tetratricopeptide (TPR) repeat protein/uncharacterized membrane protein YhaH (DUF805 family)
MAVVALAVFHPIAGFDFVLPDDHGALVDNPDVQGGLSLDSFRWALGEVRDGRYQPLTSISYLADVSVWGLRAGPIHVENLLLHLLVALLLWRWLQRTTRRAGAAFAVALLFAVHPLQVESVAWISERDGLLAAVFGLLAMDRWVSWVRHRGPASAVLAHLFFAGSILAKPVLLPLPVLLVVFDRWPLARRGSWREKSGMGAIAVAGTAVAAWAAISGRALSTLSEVGILPRLANAAVAYGNGLTRLVAPVNLGFFHPFRFDLSWTVVVGWLAVVIAASVLAWRLRDRRPAWSTGWWWWLVLLTPTVGLIQFGAQGTADRFSYLPLAGLLIMLVYGAPRPPRAFGIAIVGVAATLLAGQSARALRPWSDSVSLLEYSIQRSGGSALEHRALATAYTERGELTEALRHANLARQFAPNSPGLRFQIADLLLRLGNYDAAEETYRDGLRLDDGRAQPWAAIGRLYALRGDWEMSARAYGTATKLDPTNLDYLLGLARAMHGKGLVEEEAMLLRRVLTKDPSRTGLRCELGWIQATAPAPPLRDPDAALRLAETEQRMTDEENPRALEVLAAARAARGERNRAEELSARAEAAARAAGDAELAAKIRRRRPIYLPEGP